MHADSAKVPLIQTLSPIAIIGALGTMGAWFATLLRDAGLTIHEIDQTTEAERRCRILQDSSCVLFSVPIAKTVAIIGETIPNVASDTLLIDITSLKVRPLEAMLQHHGEVLGLHPMCAPTPAGLLNQPVVACPGRDGPKGALFRSLLQQLGANLIDMTAERHDQLMAVVQGLHHFNSIVFAHTLRTLGVSAEETINIASPVYELRMQLIGRILAQNPELYVDIELENPHVPTALRAYAQSMETFRQAIDSGSREACLEFFAEAAHAFGPYRYQALKQSDKILTVRQRKPTPR
jgi:prephenate dehydrogenase